MGDGPRNLHLVRDRETLLRLDSGVEIIRAMKHEPVSFEGMNKAAMRRLTDKVNGSKFAATWTLERYADWLAAFATQQGWLFPPSLRERVRERLNEEVGVADGEISHTIEVVGQGRYVHAYPVPD